MHQYRNLQRLSDVPQNVLHNVRNCLRLFLQVQLAWPWVNHVGQHRSRKIQTKHVNLCMRRFLHQSQYPIYQIVLNVHWDQAVFNAAFLKNGQAESLGYITVLLFFENFDNLLDHNIIVAISDVFDSSQSWNDNTDQRGNCVFQRLVFHVQNFKYEFKILC